MRDKLYIQNNAWSHSAAQRIATEALWTVVFFPFVFQFYYIDLHWVLFIGLFIYILFISYFILQGNNSRKMLKL